MSVGAAVGDVGIGVDGSCRFVDCAGGVAGCLSSKSSKRTVFGLSGVRDRLRSFVESSA